MLYYDLWASLAAEPSSVIATCNLSSMPNVRSDYSKNNSSSESYKDLGYQTPHTFVIDTQKNDVKAQNLAIFSPIRVCSTLFTA